MKTFLGAANGPMTLRTWSVSSFVSPASSFGSYVNSLGVAARQSHAGLFCGRTHGLRVTKA